MKLKKIAALTAAAAMAISMAVTVSAETVTIDDEYPGQWVSSGAGIKKADLEAVGGDVKIVLDVEVYDKFGLADQYLVHPIDYDNGWASRSSEEYNYEHPDTITSDTLTVKRDGWICVNKNDTQLEFVYSADDIASLGDDGLCFSCCNVIVHSATYEKADAKQATLQWVGDQEGKDYCFADLDAAAPAEEEAVEEVAEEAPAEEVVEEAAPAEEVAEEAAPAAEPAPVATTTSTATGNAPAMAVVAVMAVAAAAAVVTKRK